MLWKEDSVAAPVRNRLMSDMLLYMTLNYKWFTVANNNVLIITSNADQFIGLFKGCGV